VNPPAAAAPIQPGPAGAGPAKVLLETQKDNIDQLSEISRNSQTTFLALVAACVYSCLTVAATTDATLLSNSNATPLPIVQVNVPIVWFYVFAPVILTVLFIYFHLYLERFWRGIARLPLRHPDGRGLDDYVYPWLISCSLIRQQIRELSDAHRLSAWLEAQLSLVLGWWLVPLVLLYCWGRYVTTHDRIVTGLHVVLVLLTLGFALRYLAIATNALHKMLANSTADAIAPPASSVQELGPTRRQNLVIAATVILVGAALTYLSAAAMEGASGRHCKGEITDPVCARFRVGRAVWSAVGAKPDSEVRENRFLGKPGNWQEISSDAGKLRSYLDTQRGLVLAGRDLRNLDASDSFMPGSRLTGVNLGYADLSHADLTGSRLESVRFPSATLTDAVFRHAEIISSEFDAVTAMASRFDHVKFAAGDAAQPVRLSGNFSGATFSHARGGQLIVGAADGAQNPTRLNGATFLDVILDAVELQFADLGAAVIDDSALYGKFANADFSGALIRNTSMNAATFNKCRFIDVRFENVLFEEATFIDTEFDSAKSSSSDAKPAGSGAAIPRKVVVGFQAAFATFDKDTRISNLQFKKAELRSTKFNGTRFANTAFSESDLSNAEFDHVDLSGVQFEKVDLSGANLSTALHLPPSLVSGGCGNAQTRLPPGAVRLKPCVVGGRP